jgi:hypothetical protein
MKCKGKGCSNEVKEGHSELCYLEYQAKLCGYDLTAEIKDGKIWGMVFTREDLNENKSKSKDK